MNDQMNPPCFEGLLEKIVNELREKNTALGVRCERINNGYKSPIGPAAGPHTQLAGNIVASFVAGANHFELKTVQIMEGKALGISKPCIDGRHEIYNVEWSTELTVDQALSEYIKAYVMNYVLAIEFNLAQPEALTYIMSIGYDYEGITSSKIDGFIESMKDATNHETFIACKETLKTMMSLFDRFKNDDIEAMSGAISNTVALSTMHGCKKEEIKKIATYLMEDKQLNTYVKLNPTLLGVDEIEATFQSYEYKHLKPFKKVFDEDLILDEAVQLIKDLLEVGSIQKIKFGVKLTNTLPIENTSQKLEGEAIYLSGPALFPLTLQVAKQLVEIFDQRLPISYSGGADSSNIVELIQCGFYPVTFSSILLKPGGYGHIGRMNKKIQGTQAIERKQLDINSIQGLLKAQEAQKTYRSKRVKAFERQADYDDLCASCKNCVETCPNRANELVQLEGRRAVIHYDHLCNACGNCSNFCIKGHDPYVEKRTYASYQDRVKL